MNISSVKLILTISLTVVITGCTMAPPKHNKVIITSASYTKWHDSVFEKCQSKAWDVTRELVIEKSKEGYSFTEETITDIHSYLVKKCSMNSGLVI